MIIESIELSQFRNYEKLQIDFDPNTNILYGNNAQGKTNILEAAYLSGTSKSHKGNRDKELIRFNQNEAHIKTIVKKENKTYQIDNAISTGAKDGMLSMDQSIQNLFRQGRIEKSTALAYADKPDMMKRLLL